MAYLENSAREWQLSPPKRNPDDMSFDDLDEDVEEDDLDVVDRAVRGAPVKQPEVLRPRGFDGVQQPIEEGEEPAVGGSEYPEFHQTLPVRYQMTAMPIKQTAR